MIKIKDRILLSAVCGAIAFPPSRLVSTIQRRLGYSYTHYDALISSLFLSESKAQTPTGTLVGVIGNITSGSILTSIITYLLGATGRDKAIVKGIGTAAAFWILMDGMVMSEARQKKSPNPVVPLLSLVDHLIFGAVSAAAVSHLGDDSLFPDNSKAHGKLPLIYTGSTVQHEGIKH